MVLVLEGRITGGDEFLDTDLRDLAIVSGAGGTYLYASTGQNGGLSVYQISATGALASLSDSTYFGVSGITMGTFAMVSLDGTAQLMLNGTGNGALVSYTTGPDGSLTSPLLNDLPGNGAETPGALAATTLNNGTTALYMTDASGALTALVSDGAGAIAGTAALQGQAASYDLSGAVSLQVAQVSNGQGSVSFLLAADTGGQGVRAWAINQTTGALKPKGSVGAADGLGVASPTALEVVQAHGATWVLLAAAGSSSLSVMRLGADGSLTPADHLIDTLATRFGGVTALKVIEAQGHVFVLAGGADDGLSLFSLLPGGRLVHLQTLVHTTGAGLENITAIEAVETDGEIQIFVTSGTAAGLSQFSIPVDDLGSVIDASSGGTGGATLRGTSHADLIVGAPGQDILIGEAGDDILVAGANGGVLTGGSGADIFVLCPTSEPLRITDFHAGTDQIDMSHFPMLRSVGQLTLTRTSSGVIIEYGDTTISVLSHDGKPLTGAQIWPGGFATPDRVLIPDGPVIQVTQGDGNNDLLNGNAGQDMIYGLGGDDTIRAGAGNDRIEGGEGNDTIWGGAGSDRINGGAGDDTSYGGTGSDRLYGGAGNDHLNGDAGDDRLYGGTGDDTLQGGTGNDRLSGDDGKDLLNAGDGNDHLYGGAGNDKALGGNGNDRLYGGTGNDHLNGQAGNDRVYGSKGDDVLLGGKGRDKLFGGAGKDTLKGGKGRDVLRAGAEADRLNGEAGKDMLKGGKGHDQLNGGAGKDTLIGGKGDDILTGGAGADIFVFGKRQGDDRITDFTDGIDLIRITAPGTTFDDLTFTRQGGDTLIDTGTGARAGSITIDDTRPGDFSADDFLFS